MPWFSGLGGPGFKGMTVYKGQLLKASIIKGEKRLIRHMAHPFFEPGLCLSVSAQLNSLIFLKVLN